jgi:thiosulfate reductase cytochrome b subunit
VPTSWDVVPNAISAALQYASLNWPTENGWVNYNGLQLLAYFATVFIAAPLAHRHGRPDVAGSGPHAAKPLDRVVYPIGDARAIHLPVMFYFVAFTIVHVTLVLSTGALRNLNHMYGGQDAVNWVGFIIFVVSLLVIVAGWFAARPTIVAPIASLFGKVART